MILLLRSASPSRWENLGRLPESCDENPRCEDGIRRIDLALAAIGPVRRPAAARAEHLARKDAENG